jgi:hypothetical protein
VYLGVWFPGCLPSDWSLVEALERAGFVITRVKGGHQRLRQGLIVEDLLKYL